MKKILLNGDVGKNKFAIVDISDYKALSEMRWYLGKNGYPTKSDYNKITKKHSCVTMHRYLMRSKGIDHINGNKLDNRRKNLRTASPRQNLANARKRKGCTSKFKGVYYDRWSVCAGKNWVAQINIGYKKRKTLGHFLTELEAAQAYGEAAKKVFGEFARLF